MFEQLLARIAGALRRHEIPSMVIGGQAVLLYGEPRLTRDIDLTLGVGTERLPEVLALLPEIPLLPLPEDAVSFVERTLVLPALHHDSGVRVDFVFSFTPFERAAIARARRVPLGGEPVPFASPEDLIIHKIFAGRPRDLEDVASIVRMQVALDESYIRRWLQEFDAAADEPTFLKRFLAILSAE